MLTVANLLKNAVERLKLTSPTALLDAEILFCHVSGLDRVGVFMSHGKPVSEEIEKDFEKLLDGRVSGVPIAYLTGVQEFMGLSFQVNPDVLIPRPDTEILVETIMNQNQDLSDLSILDIGTGSGAIALSLAKLMNRVSVTAVDISKGALATASENARLLEVTQKVTFVEADILKGLQPEHYERYDILVSNPPYIPTTDIDGLQIEVAVHEPRGALDGGTDGLDFYRKIAADGLKYLVKTGRLYFEVGHDQSGQVMAIMKQLGYEDIGCCTDLQGFERVVYGRYPNR